MYNQIIMTTNSIHIVYHPTIRGYSGYSRELDGLRTEGRTIQELYEKVKYLIEVRVKSLAEIGREKEAKDLREKEINFVED